MLVGALLLATAAISERDLAKRRKAGGTEPCAVAGHSTSHGPHLDLGGGAAQRE